MPAPYIDISPIWVLPSQGQEQVMVDQRLKVRARSTLFSRSKGTGEFSGDVVATFGVTQVKAQRLSLKTEGNEFRYAVAEGDVELSDPIGTISGDRLTFDWTENKGEAINVRILVGEVEFKAERGMYENGEWHLYRVVLTPCQHTASVALRSNQIRIRLSEVINFYQVSLLLGGRSVFTLPSLYTNLNPRNEGVRVPKIQRDAESGWSAGWDFRTKISPRTFASASVTFSERRQPSTSVIATHEFIPAAADLFPRHEFSDRIGDGFFDDLGTESPETDFSRYSQKRLNVSLARSWNLVRNGTAGERISKPFEAILEGSGKVGKVGLFGQIRSQQIGLVGEDSFHRDQIWLRAVGEPIDLVKGVRMVSYAESRTYFRSESAGWLRGLIGLESDIAPGVSLGVGYAGIHRFGTLDFRADEFESANTVQGRLDWNRGATKFRVLGIYEPRSGKWFDRQVYVSQVMGCIEPFAIYRDRSKSTSIGILFRPFEDFKKKKSQELKRTPGNEIQSWND